MFLAYSITLTRHLLSPTVSEANREGEPTIRQNRNYFVSCAWICVGKRPLCLGIVH